MKMEYADFVKSKLNTNRYHGFDISIDDIKSGLFPFQKAIAKWAVKKGKAAVFADTGLGKTAMQLEFANQVHKKTGNPVLIIAPLAVGPQTIVETEKRGICKVNSILQSGKLEGVNIINYESLHKINPLDFDGVVLDESSILKSFMGKTKQSLISNFAHCRYKLACTATPAPNDYMELGNHSDFLDVMSSNEMLSRWFINDTMNFGTYRLKGHAVKSFWEWVGTWAVCVNLPSDIGDYSNEGYVLPGLNLTENIVDVDITSRRDDGELFHTPDINAASIYAEMNYTAEDRTTLAANMANANKEYYLVWCNTNNESALLKKKIPDAVEVKGSDNPADKERNLTDFANGKIRVLITKPSIAGYGLNFQRCSNVIFVGLSYSFEDFYQALRRSYRFGQKSVVNAHIISASTETRVLDRVKEKMKQHEEMKANMVYASAQFNDFADNKELSNNNSVKVETCDSWTMYNGDCVNVSKTIADNSIDFSVFSPPFSNLYIYSDSVYDMGNCVNDNEFFTQFDFLITELFRITRPGRLVAVHCKDLVNYKGRDGKAGLRDFPGEIIRRFINKGFAYHSKITIWKDPVIEMQRTKAHGLLHKQVCKDSTFSRQGLPDYMVIFRKWSESESDDIKPVGSAENSRFDSYVGESGPVDKDDARQYSINVWQRYASPVWFDIQQTNVLNIQQARESQDEKHICPLQLDVIDRCLHLWTNPGDLVFSPFAGIGSEGYSALKMGRRFVGVELKQAYFDVAVKNLSNAISRQVDIMSYIEQS